MTTINITERGESLIKELTELRRVFLEISKTEHSISPQSFDDVQSSFLKSMREFESEIIEEIYDENDFESAWRERHVLPKTNQVRFLNPTTKKDTKLVIKPLGLSPEVFVQNILDNHIKPKRTKMKLKYHVHLYYKELDKQVDAFLSKKDVGAVKIRPSRRKHTKAQIKNYILPFFSETDIDKIDGRLISKFQQDLLYKMKAITTKEVVRVVRKMLLVFWLHELIDKVPASEEIVKISHDKGPERPTPNYEQVQKTLLHAENIEHETMIRLACETGLRISEILALSWGSIRRGIIEVKYAAVEREVLATKTKDSMRQIKISDELKSNLAEFKLSSDNTNDEDYLFVNSNGRLYTNTGVARKILWKAQDKAGVDRYGWHGLRRFYINYLLDAGVTEHHVQKLVGHTIGTNTTSKHYRRVNIQDVLKDAYVVEVG